MPITPVTIADLTAATIEGNGVFDVLMRANKAHLDAQFKEGRLKGADYATVYLGSLQAVMSTALQFLLNKDKISLEAQLIEAQVAQVNAQTTLTQTEVGRVTAQIEQIEQQTANLIAEALNLPKQGVLLDAQAAQVQQQTTNLISEELRIDAQTAQLTAETANAGKQGLVLDKQAAHITQQTLNLVSEELKVDAETARIAAETTNAALQGDVLVAEAAHRGQQTEILIKEALRTVQQTTNLAAEAVNIPKQGAILDAELAHTTAKVAQVEEQTALLTEQRESEAFRNFVDLVDPTKSGILSKEREVLIAQECKLRAEYDLVMESKLKTAEEKMLLAQKTLTERAQVTELGVDANSVIGKQKLLYTAQADGFSRDAEQKVAKILIDTWNVRRTTDEGTVADTVNKLNDTTLGRVVDKLLTGVGA